MLMIILNVDEKYEPLIQRDGLEMAAFKTIETCLDKEVALTIVITGDKQIRRLNEHYRGMGKTTDVLSFPADYMDPDLEKRYLGDVVISYPTAKSQSQERAHGVGEELQLLVVHGVLHLLGYVHLEETGQEEMASVQARILQELDLDLEIKGW